MAGGGFYEERASGRDAALGLQCIYSDTNLGPMI